MDENYVLKEVFEERMKATDAENERQNHRLSLLEQNGEMLNKLVVSVEKLAVSMDTMRKELEKQGERLDKIEDEPADKWRKLTWMVITAVVGAVIGYFLSKAGM